MAGLFGPVVVERSLYREVGIAVEPVSLRAGGPPSARAFGNLRRGRLTAHAEAT